MPLPYHLTFCHELLARHLGPGDLAVDATAGNGQDTLFLTRAVTPGGRVFAFDIQQSALDATRARLQSAGIGSGCELFLAGHETLGEHLPLLARGRVKAAMFNLGYLPGANTSLITHPQTTVAALSALAEWMAPGGLLTVMCYTGHPGGKEEEAAVAAYCQAMPWQKARVLRHGFINEPKNSTVLYCLEYAGRGRQA
ncbi:tRNA (mnm(5)s(2)U34)-methyltransferase [Megalodesulfovibrio paquesii]